LAIHGAAPQVQLQLIGESLRRIESAIDTLRAERKLTGELPH
jgi:hypothetical protein